MNEKLLLAAVAGRLRICACSRPAVTTVCGEPVCAHCLAIEATGRHAEPPVKRRPLNPAPRHEP